MEKIVQEQGLENEDLNAEKNGKRRVTYVARTLKPMLEFVTNIHKGLGSSDYHTNIEIAAVNKLAPNSIKTQLSTCQQYKLLELKHGSGYKITELFTRIILYTNEFDKKAAIIESLKSPDTYQQLFRDYESQVLPSQTGVKNFFIRNYGFKDDIAEKAANIFIDNLNDFNLLDNRGVLISGIALKQAGLNETRNEQQEEQNKSTSSTANETELFELPIPLPNKKRAYLRYPINSLTKKDISVITKALEFIASSLEDE